MPLNIGACKHGARAKTHATRACGQSHGWQRTPHEGGASGRGPARAKRVSGYVPQCCFHDGVLLIDLAGLNVIGRDD